MRRSPVVVYTIAMKQTKSDKRVFGVLYAALVVAVMAIMGVVWAVWYDLNIGFGAPAHPDFKGYTSSEQLNNSSLKSSQLIRAKEFALDIWSFDYVLKYDSGLTVYERSAGNYPDVVANCEFRAKGVSGNYYHTCDVFSTKNGGRYAVMTSVYKGELFAITVEALIDNTSFYVDIPEGSMSEFAKYNDWQTYFDSMQPVNLETTQFELKTHHQGGG